MSLLHTASAGAGEPTSKMTDSRGFQVSAVCCFSPHMLLLRAAWSSSQHGGWVPRASLEMTDTSFLQPASGYWYSVTSTIFYWLSSYRVHIQGEGMSIPSLNGTSAKEFCHHVLKPPQEIIQKGIDIAHHLHPVLVNNGPWDAFLSIGQ